MLSKNVQQHVTKNYHLLISPFEFFVVYSGWLSFECALVGACSQALVPAF